LLYLYEYIRKIEYIRVGTVGIIVNPASGKDIRRVIAAGTVVTNQEKINIVLRMLRACDTVGVDRVLIMPDPTHIGRRVINEARGELLHTTVEELQLPYILGTWKDTLRATECFVEMEVDCLVVMGGDGTSRIVAKACADIPILSVSTGTNNVFPRMTEGTLAGLAAAAIASGTVTQADACRRAPRLELHDNEGEFLDIALVDLVMLDTMDIGARAVWDSASIKALFLTMASPSEIGLSSVGGWLAATETPKGCALAVYTDGAEGKRLVAPIAPGLLAPITVSSHYHFDSQSPQELPNNTGVIALDGEREVLIGDRRLTVSINPQGPLVIQVDRTLQAAAAAGMLDTAGLPELANKPDSANFDSTNNE
jgi:predicted polyphosphate/ATP-dependent NAD kinase